MKIRRRFGVLPHLVLGALSFVIAGCPDKPAGPSAAAGDPPKPSIVAEPAVSPLSLVIVYGSEKKTWLEEQVKKFEALGKRTAGGRPIKIDARAMGSGEAMQAVTGGTVKAHVFSPASTVYVSLANSAWLSQPGHTKALIKPGEPLLLSPVVVGMWKPMAEALGWPKRQLSWADLLKVATNPKGWAASGNPEWGRFKFGHTHPEYSNSGFLGVLAEAYAGAKKTRDLSVADLDNAATQAFVAQVEDTIVHYGKSTGFFADKMLERGPTYLSAAVLYENLVVEAYSKPSPFPLVAIYPVEGTFWSDHPYAMIDGDWVGNDERAAADAFLAFLKAKPQQERALALGFRPADPTVPMGAPIDAAHGADPRQPQTVLAIPEARTLDRLLSLWHANKKGSDVVLVFDKSGSMRGNPLVEAKMGAKSFLAALADRDEASLMFFDSQLYPPTTPAKLLTGKAALDTSLDNVMAEGGTALYDAIAAAYDGAEKRAKARPGQIHAVVVMTDGRDEGSTKMTLEALKQRLVREDSQVRVFTIAYGDQAEGKILGDIAEAAKGSFAKGSVQTIREVFVDMASFL